ncbi:serine hydrolase domain-containing protein [Kitasatospora sp. NPDC086801]|uniref:serine hydrolase domain-containing protein n=1 Tax=Kitasatospora sp. NPDC086801 TaxID=3364066 RepID=UPI0037F6F0F3
MLACIHQSEFPFCAIPVPTSRGWNTAERGCCAAPFSDSGECGGWVLVNSQSWREKAGRLAREHGVRSLRCAFYDAGELHVAEAGAEPGPAPAAPFASLTKLFTATLAMQLAFDGDLDLDLPVGEYLTEPSFSELRLTTRHLLSHSSGMVCDGPGDGGLRAAVAAGPLFAPGTAFSYSNAGFALAGKVIEAAAGVSWRSAVTDFLLRPLDIEPAFLAAEEIPRDLAPAAAIAGTVTDLVAFARLHLDDRDASHAALLDREAVRELAEPPFDTLPFGLADGWGHGWARYGNGADRWLGLDGVGAGATCHLRIQPERGTVIALQADSAAGLGAWQDLLAQLRAEGVDIAGYAPGPAAGAAQDLSDRVGQWANGETVYRIRPGADAADGAHPGATVLVDDDGMEYDLTGRGERFFAARHPRLPEVEHLGRFLLDPETGRADHMQFGGRVLRRVA